MPLSDHEQRLLDQIEQALYADDPKFASAVRSGRGGWRARRMLALGILGILAGLALVLVGLISTVIVLSVVGFVLLVASSALSLQAIRGGVSVRTDEPEQPSKPVRSAGLRSRMEERMRRRFEDE